MVLTGPQLSCDPRPRLFYTRIRPTQAAVHAALSEAALTIVLFFFVLSAPLQVLFKFVKGLRQILTAKADAERVEPLSVEGSGQEQNSCLLQ